MIKKPVSAKNWKTLPKLKKFPAFESPATWFFGNAKGGVGKTTLAFNFAHFLNDHRPGKVLFISTDLQKNAENAFMAPEDDLIFDEELHITATQLFSAEEDAEGNLAPYSALGELSVFRTTDEIGFIPTRKDFAETERLSYDNLLNLAINIDYICQEFGFEHVIIDSRPSGGFTIASGLVASDLVIVPCQPHQFSFEGLCEISYRMRGANSERINLGWPPLKLVGVVFNLVPKESKAAAQDLKDLYDICKDAALPNRIHDRAPIREAITAGIPVWEKRIGGSPQSSEEILNFCIEAVKRGHKMLTNPDHNPYDDFIGELAENHEG